MPSEPTNAACSCQPKGGLPHGEHPYDYGYDDPAECPVHGIEPRFAEIRIDELEAENQRLREMNDRLADENLSLRNALQRERTKRGIAFSFIPEECHEEYADRLMIVDGDLACDLGTALLRLGDADDRVSASDEANTAWAPRARITVLVRVRDWRWLWLRKKDVEVELFRGRIEEWE